MTASYRHKQIFKGAFAILLLLLPFTASAADAPRKSKSGSGREQTFTVVIDAGHGGHDHGAIDNGAKEKDINLGVAKKFAAKIKKKLKNVKVVMTRDDDTFISLQERANIANRNKGNLFVSIHTNSVDKKNPNRKTVAGTSVYALGPQKEANNLRVAQRENSVIELEDNYHAKYSGFDPSKDESYIIFEMAQKKNLGQSLRFADKAQNELVRTANRKDRGVKQAGFWVLWATAMPSVLVELDFICNPTEAAFLISDSGQEKLAEALTNALGQYIAAQNTPSSVQIDNTERDKRNVEAEESNEVYDDSYDGVRTLVSKKDTKQTKRVHVSKSKNNKTTSARRRRSEASKQKSDNRSLETEEITLSSEQEYLAQQDQTDKKSEVKDADSKDADKNAKKKKSKKKKQKDKKKDKKKQSDKSDKIRSENLNQKTIAVKKSSGKLEARNKTQEAAGAAGSYYGTKTSGASAMEYTIILVTSDRELALDDPAFCGLVPGGSFKENGLYKYTYGRSTSRKEIEKLLLDVKTVIPDATIVVRMK